MACPLPVTSTGDVGVRCVPIWGSPGHRSRVATSDQYVLNDSTVIFALMLIILRVCPAVENFLRQPCALAECNGHGVSFVGEGQLEAVEADAGDAVEF